MSVPWRALSRKPQLENHTGSNHSDILVDGPYLPNDPGRHPLTASANQRVHFLTPRGRALRRVTGELPTDHANLGLTRDGDPRGLLIGVVRPAARARLHRRLGLARHVMAEVRR